MVSAGRRVTAYSQRASPRAVAVRWTKYMRTTVPSCAKSMQKMLAHRTAVETMHLVAPLGTDGSESSSLALYLILSAFTTAGCM